MFALKSEGHDVLWTFKQAPTDVCLSKTHIISPRKCTPNCLRITLKLNQVIKRSVDVRNFFATVETLLGRKGQITLPTKLDQSKMGLL